MPQAKRLFLKVLTASSGWPLGCFFQGKFAACQERSMAFRTLHETKNQGIALIEVM
jgi:hypothetical protein